MSTRQATPYDFPQFIELWEAMLLEIHSNYPKADSGPTRQNLNHTKTLFDSYVKGFAKGVVVLWTPSKPELPTKPQNPAEGVFMAGGRVSGQPSLESRWERPAWIHGIYVAPPYRRVGAWRALHRHATRELRLLGFTDVLGHVPAGHAESFRMNTIAGGEAYAILMEKSLRE